MPHCLESLSRNIKPRYRKEESTEGAWLRPQDMLKGYYMRRRNTQLVLENTLAGGRGGASATMW